MERFWMTTRGLEPNDVGAWVRYADAQRALDVERTAKEAYQSTAVDLRKQLATLQAQLADRDAMILQMGEQAAVLAKENMAVKTQLRQVVEDVLHTFDYLRFHRVAGMDGLLYETHNKMSPERTVEACEKRIRATLDAQDAGKGAGNG